MSLYSPEEICEGCLNAIFHVCCNKFCSCAIDAQNTYDQCSGICPSKALTAEAKLQKLVNRFVRPLMGTCSTCAYATYGGANADADDCQREGYDGSDPKCVDDWWEGGECIKWEMSKLLKSYDIPER